MSNYREFPAESQSNLKQILVHPLLYKNRDNKSTKSLNMGSLVDCLLLTPEDFDSTYFINDKENPSDTVKSIWDEIYISYKTVPVLDFDIEILNICKKMKYRAKQSDIVKLKYIHSFSHYFHFLKNSEGKIIVSNKDYQKACELTNKLNEDPIINKLLFNLPKHKTNVFQEEIYWDKDGINLKSLLDVITIDKKNKIIQPWDLKTTGFSVSSFKNSLWKFRYDFQASFYSEALRFKYPDYVILPFRFIVVSTAFNDRPRIFECSGRILDVGENGDENYKGWKEALELLKFYSKNEIWNDTKEHIEGGDIVQLM
jgi:hypothetical protein